MRLYKENHIILTKNSLLTKELTKGTVQFYRIMFSKGFLTIEDIVHESLLSRTGAVNLIKGITYTQDLKFVKACLVKLEKQREVKYKHINI